MFPIWLASKRAGHNECPVCLVYPVRHPVGPFINLDSDRVQPAPSPTVLPQTGHSPCAGLALVIVACRCYISQGRVSCAVWGRGGWRRKWWRGGAVAQDTFPSCPTDQVASRVVCWLGQVASWPVISYGNVCATRPLHEHRQGCHPDPTFRAPFCVCVRDERVSSIKEFELNFSTLDELNIFFLGGIVCGSGYTYLGMCKRVEIPF